MYGAWQEPSPHQNITVIVTTRLGIADSISQLKKVVDNVRWVDWGDKKKDRRKEKQKGKSIPVIIAAQGSYTFSSRSLSIFTLKNPLQLTFDFNDTLV